MSVDSLACVHFREIDGENDGLQLAFHSCICKLIWARMKSNFCSLYMVNNLNICTVQI